MKKIVTDPFIILILCIVSGIVDVVGYIGFGHIFTANMTGNIVILGLAIGHSEGIAVARSILALIGFICGNGIAIILIHYLMKSSRAERIFRWNIGLELLILLVFAVGLYLHLSISVSILLLSVAMGIQTSCARKVGVSGISTTVLTNNLAALIEAIVSRCVSKSNVLNKDAYLRGSAIVLYTLGAIVGAVLMQFLNNQTIWVAIVLVAVVYILLLARSRQVITDS